MESAEVKIPPGGAHREREAVPAEPAPTGRERPRLSDPSSSWHYVQSRCPLMQALEQRALRVAYSDETVLILGETGVGKDLLARLVHENSTRRGKPFVHLNCAALPEGLLESELFGHMRGSYTGASDSRPGQFEAASGGSLFLDEIGEVPPRLQAKLLHVLQEKKIYRVGGRQAVAVDVRIVAATNRDLGEAMKTGSFRRDLFYRLSVVTFRIPPLRERPEDLESLAMHFFRRYASLYNRRDLSLPDERFCQLLRNSRWDGNIRELENVVKRVILLGGVEHLAEEMADGMPRDEGRFGASPITVTDRDGRPLSLREAVRRAAEQAERQAIVRTLDRTAWNRKKAARELRMSYRSLLYKIKGYTLRPGALPEDEERSEGEP
jgi:transcriptional regulator with GAF, ATPase, and Fis domain